ncbi:PKD domain-containing protein [Candidatus Bipolaricaulota bacterium]
MQILMLLAGICMVVGFVGLIGWSQSWPRCITGCTAKDVTLENVYLNHLTSCEGDEDPIQAELWVSINFNRNNSYCVRFVTDVYINGILTEQDLVSEPYVFTTKGVYEILVDTINWTCGAVLELRNIQIFWSVDNSLTDPSLCAGCSDYVPGSKCIGYTTVESQDPLVADFYADGPNGCAPLQVVFYSTSWGGYSTDQYIYDWDFGDGTAHSTAEDPIHTYWSPGTYTVSLTVTDTLGESDTKTRTLYIEAYDCRLDIDKTGDAGPVNFGDIVNYTIRITNIGNVILHNVTLVDAKLGINQNVGDLAPTTFVDVAGNYGPVTAADLPGPIVNIASATSDETPQPVEDDHSVEIISVLEVTVDGLTNLAITQPLIGQLEPRQSLGELLVSVVANVNYEVHVYYTVNPSPSPGFLGDPLVFEYPNGVWTTILSWPSMAALPGLSGTQVGIYPIGVDLPLLGDRSAGTVFQFTVHVVVSEVLGP